MEDDNTVDESRPRRISTWRKDGNLSMAAVGGWRESSKPPTSGAERLPGTYGSLLFRRSEPSRRGAILEEGVDEGGEGGEDGQSTHSSVRRPPISRWTSALRAVTRGLRTASSFRQAASSARVGPGGDEGVGGVVWKLGDPSVPMADSARALATASGGDGGLVPGRSSPPSAGGGPNSSAPLRGDGDAGDEGGVGGLLLPAGTRPASIDPHSAGSTGPTDGGAAGGQALPAPWHSPTTTQPTTATAHFSSSPSSAALRPIKGARSGKGRAAIDAGGSEVQFRSPSPTIGEDTTLNIPGGVSDSGGGRVIARSIAGNAGSMRVMPRSATHATPSVFMTGRRFGRKVVDNDDDDYGDDNNDDDSDNNGNGNGKDTVADTTGDVIQDGVIDSGNGESKETGIQRSGAAKRKTFANTKMTQAIAPQRRRRSSFTGMVSAGVRRMSEFGNSKKNAAKQKQAAPKNPDGRRRSSLARLVNSGLNELMRAGLNENRHAVEDSPLIEGVPWKWKIFVPTSPRRLTVSYKKSTLYHPPKLAPPPCCAQCFVQHTKACPTLRVQSRTPKCVLPRVSHVLIPSHVRRTLPPYLPL